MVTPLLAIAVECEFLYLLLVNWDDDLGMVYVCVFSGGLKHMHFPARESPVRFVLKSTLIVSCTT